MMLRWTGEKDTKALTARLKQCLSCPGSVVLLPTETVYALVCRAADSEAQAKIVELKKRPANKKFGWFVPDWRDLERFGLTMDAKAEALAARFMPGALTLIVPSAANGTQGIRIPDHPLLLELLAVMDEPLVQTSANASGMPDPRNAADALAQLAGEVTAAVDGGELPEGSCGSTVADLSGHDLKILRAGGISEAALVEELKIRNLL